MLDQGAEAADARAQPQGRGQAVALGIGADVLGQVRGLAQGERGRGDLVGCGLGALDELRCHLGGGDEGPVAGDGVVERDRLERRGLEEPLGPSTVRSPAKS